MTSKRKSPYLTVFDLLSPKHKDWIVLYVRTMKRLAQSPEHIDQDYIWRAGLARTWQSTFISYGRGGTTHLNCNYSTSTPIPPLNSSSLPFPPHLLFTHCYPYSWIKIEIHSLCFWMSFYRGKITQVVKSDGTHLLYEAIQLPPPTTTWTGLKIKVGPPTSCRNTLSAVAFLNGSYIIWNIH